MGKGRLYIETGPCSEDPSQNYSGKMKQSLLFACWCAILIAHQLSWQNMEAPVSILRNLRLQENLARDCFTSTAPTVTNSVQNSFTRLRYCGK